MFARGEALSETVGEFLQSAANRKRARNEDDEKFSRPLGGTVSLSSDRMLFAGYYSLELGLVEENLACIVVLPCFASMGLGRFLIAASYEYGTRRAHKAHNNNSNPGSSRASVGSPERPLSDLGRLSYYLFWRERLVQVMLIRSGKWVLQQLPRAVRDQQPFRGWSLALERFGSVRAMDSDENIAALTAAVQLCHAKCLALQQLEMEQEEAARKRSSAAAAKRRVQNALKGEQEEQSSLGGVGLVVIDEADHSDAKGRTKQTMWFQPRCVRQLRCCKPMNPHRKRSGTLSWMRSGR